MSELPTQASADTRPAATQSIHGDFLEKAVPRWLVDATPARRSALKHSTTPLPSAYKTLSTAQRRALDASVKACAIAQVRLDTTMATFQDIEAFARPLLLNALKDQYQVKADVDATLLCLRRTLAISVLDIEIDSFEFLKLSMLQACLHNFEAWECEPNAYHSSSGFMVPTKTAGTFEPITINLSVSQFMTLCRSLDIGAQYQTYLASFFAPVDASPEPPLRQHFMASQKATMRAAAEHALAIGDIEPADHAMIVSVINGNLYPTLGNERVWLLDMSLMKKRLTGCVYFAIGDPYGDELILYIPHDPAHPLKRYTRQQLRDEFKRLFTAREGMAADDPAPTAYQRFFSQFVPYDQRPYYFSQFTQKSDDSPSGPLSSPWRKFVEFVFGMTPITRIKELPPEQPAKMEPVSDPYLAPGSLMPYRGTGTFSGLLDLWPYLYEKYRDKLLADARAHAVPTAQVDAKAREAKLAHLFEVGMLVLNAASMFVPVLGEVMMAVMVEQLLAETVQGSIEWAEGDKRAARDHLIDVAQNLAQIAVMTGVGAAVSKFRAVKAQPVLENLSPVTLPNGETRLWKPDLTGYESPVTLDANAVPNAEGQYRLGGRTYIRLGDQVYEQVFDESIKCWRIKHPTQAEVYQPILQSNGRGAWRHTLERPAEWDRLTLLRRMGHETDAFTDTELLKVADVSGVSDSALRKMHMDLALAPPELLDAMRLFKADAGAGQVIEQLRGSQPIDERYLFALPLVVEMPRWPKTRVLEVFKGPALAGESITYGAGRVPRGGVAQASIQISRADVLDGRLPAVILTALDESQVTSLLGGEGARVPDARVQEFGKQIADYAQTRKPAIFDSLYAGTEPLDSQVRRLQRSCPGLSEAAARETLAHASPDDLKRLEATHKVPLNLQEEARWYALQGRQTRAYAGLRSETMASADSRRLALHTLEKLPGWPDTLRLEVREGSYSGTLLDSIGSRTARDTRYVVKKGPRFQAFDARGEALNSMPTEGDNFYASLMHAMPDNARQGLGVPQVSQSAQLREKLITFADLYRSQAPHWLAPQSSTFKPPARINERIVGYYASGRAAGQTLSLEARAQTLYGLSDVQASDYILQLQAQGKSNKAIFNHLQNREHDYGELVKTLDEWVQASRDGATGHHTNNKSLVASQLKEAWRREPLAGTVDNAARLHINVDEHLPPLTVDFAHIHELAVVGRKIGDAEVEAFLTRFPNVQTLSVGDSPRLWRLVERGDGSSLTTLPLAVTQMARLRSLRLGISVNQLAPEFFSRLSSLTSLEALHIDYRGLSPNALNGLDLSALVQLRQLQIEAPGGLSRWPANVENLPNLERLDLRHTAISELPATLYSGHEKLWAGLSMDWSRFPREPFKRAYDYVRTYKGERGHLVDLHQMVSEYAKGKLRSLKVDYNLANSLHQEILKSAPTPEARFAVIEQISDQYADVFAPFYAAQEDPVSGYWSRSTQWRGGPNEQVISELEANWWRAIGERYGIAGDASVFELQAPVFVMDALSQVHGVDLPELPAASFAHVRTLRLQWPVASIEQARGFIRAFSETRSLELNGLGLTEIPIGTGDLPALTRLDLSHNSLAMPTLQAQLNDLPGLEVLDLSHNSHPLTEVDVSALTQLRALNVRQTGLNAWPAGAEGLPDLEWLDLRDNQLASLPLTVLADDAALMKTNLTGNRLNAASQAALDSARQRVEVTQGLPSGALARFEQQRVPAVFPPQESGLTMRRHLLPMPQQIAVAEGAAGFVKRLQQLSPLVTDEKALLWFEQLRSGGMSDPHIDTLLTTWHQEYVGLTRQLNGWLYTRELTGPDVSLMAEERQSVALKIIECWQAGVSADAGYELSLHGLRVDNLPELTVQFSHVHTLNLTAVGFSASGAEGFLNSFPEVRKLILSGNELSVVPEAVGRMAQLEALDLNTNAIADPEPLYRLSIGAHLRRLDLGKNRLVEFSAQTFNRLERLNLSYNRLEQWPSGTLALPNLTTLDLCGNYIVDLPSGLFNGRHDALVSGTDLADNEPLSRDSLERMRVYGLTHNGPVMGWDQSEIAGWIRGFEHTSDEAQSSSDSDESADVPLENIVDPSRDSGETVLSSWLTHSPQGLAAPRRQMWQQLAQEPLHECFFHLLERLRDTDEFRFQPVDLTRRVWEVIESAVGSSEMRESLFAASATHGTCIDGRILTFSSLEVMVLVERVLCDVPTRSLKVRGQRLLALSRQLFRLEQVDTLAMRNAAGRDEAEVRLEYRLGLTRGWPDGLELPGQPSRMAFGTPISGAVLTSAREQVLAAQASDAFYERLIRHDYWNQYLEERYPDEFQQLQRDADAAHEAVEDEYADREEGTDSQQRYEAAMNQLQFDRESARVKLRLELSRQEVHELSADSVVAAPGRPTSPQPGPSTRQ
ncbi:Leucine-rich repeat (LRR) protein [Pseudomonas sp. W3I7]|uniref:NEL-type E3 ubiquitin ligase domain-containing protein n=1 Tax=Pseudomonas sp. W3I7 TaxID=3042292 RepID=UPI00278DE665|nr:NEL-type E3 ubiquitin ligase domain-containing protein [Pseudomonas sp. W3I7]MDQ0704449.1 Leucine-rich repeat (LRR) protein [Pseudomonas sp. W3I7]